MIELPICKHRGVMDKETYRFTCTSPNLIVGPLGVDADLCNRCMYANKGEVKKLPSPTTNPCIHMGDTSRIELCATCKGSVRIKVHKCTVYGECTVQAQVNGVKTCVGCDRHTGTNGITIHQGACGIGDVIDGLHVVSKLKQDNPSTRIIYNVSHVGKMYASLFNGYDELGDIAVQHWDKAIPGGRAINIGYGGEKKGYARRIDRYAGNVASGGYVPITLRDEVTVRAMGRGSEGTIVLCPSSTDPNREWSLQHWYTLNRMLVDVGYECTVLLPHNIPNHRFIGRVVVRELPMVVVGNLLNSRCVVGSDSGLPHISGALGIPTIVLGGSTDVDSIFSFLPSVSTIQGKLSCNACYCRADSEWSERCKYSCSNLQSIQPNEVLREIDRRLLTTYRTLLDVDRLSTIRSWVVRNRSIDGYLAEVGVYKGGVSKMMSELDPTYIIYMFDTFKGLPTDDTLHGKHKTGDFSDTTFDEVRKYVGEGVRYQYRRGYFPSTVDTDPDIRFKMVHIDGDLYRTTIDAIDYFLPRMVRGGVMIFDDYGWYMTQGVQEAVHECFNPDRIHVTKGSYQCVVQF